MGDVASADIVVVQVDAVGPGGMVVDGDVLGLLEAARVVEVPVWVEAGVGRVLPPRLWEALTRKLSSATKLRAGVMVDLAGVERVVGPSGALSGAPGPGRHGLPGTSGAPGALVGLRDRAGSVDAHGRDDRVPEQRFRPTRATWRCRHPGGEPVPASSSSRSGGGSSPTSQDVCDRFAAAGFVALAPDLYRGTKVDRARRGGKAMMAMQLDRAGRDMSGAVDELRRRSGDDTVGVVGFCMGGGLALVLATQRPDASRRLRARSTE